MDNDQRRMIALREERDRLAAQLSVSEDARNWRSKVIKEMRARAEQAESALAAAQAQIERMRKLAKKLCASTKAVDDDCCGANMAATARSIGKKILDALGAPEGQPPPKGKCKRCNGTGYAPGSDADSRWPHNFACRECKGNGGDPALGEMPAHMVEPAAPAEQPSGMVVCQCASKPHELNSHLFNEDRWCIAPRPAPEKKP